MTLVLGLRQCSGARCAFTPCVCSLRHLVKLYSLRHSCGVHSREGSMAYKSRRGWRAYCTTALLLHGVCHSPQLRCTFTRGANDSLRLAWMPHPRLQRARARVVNLLRLTWVYGLRHRSGVPSCELPMAHSTIHGSMACGTAAAVRLHARCPRHTALDLGVWPTA